MNLMCPKCQAPLSEGSFGIHHVVEPGAEAMTEWVDITTTVTLRCLKCFERLHQMETKTRSFTTGG